MKTNISKNVVDTNKLNEEIESFEVITDQDAYLFMNKETIGCIKDLCPFIKELNSSDFPSGIPAKFQGRKVYMDNDLKFGEVEIR